MGRIEWRKNQITHGRLNAELYSFVDNIIAPYKTDPPHDIWNDARLISRELVDNIYRHNSALVVVLVLDLDQSNHVLKIQIYHDGDEFDPFDPARNCKLLVARNQEYRFNTKYQRNQNGNFELNLTFNFSPIVGDQNE